MAQEKSVKMLQESIKECPFCGGHASFRESARPLNQNVAMIEYAICKCDSCGAAVSVNREEVAKTIKEICIQKWNSRI